MKLDVSSGVHMNKIDCGKNVIGIAKSLKQFKAGDPHIAANFFASSFAGRSGLLAAALRSQTVNYNQLLALAAVEGISLIELNTVVEWLKNSGLCDVKSNAEGKIQSVTSIVLSYDNILAGVTDLFESLNPSKNDRACISLLDRLSVIPMLESEAMTSLAKEYGEQTAGVSISLAKSYRLMDYREGFGLPEPVLYRPQLWATNIKKASKALSSVSQNDRALILEMVDRVRKYQGMPLQILESFAASQNVSPLLKTAIGIRLIHETKIEMKDGNVRVFLTTPHFYEEIASEHGQDVCDRVKIFLDSVRNGQHFGSGGTGRILNPAVLLEALLNRGRIGPCTAIGTDYVTSEKAGIVRVERAYGSRCNLILVQEDTVRKVHDVVTNGTVADPTHAMKPENIREGNGFRSIEECGQQGEVPEDVAEAERAIIMQLREGG